MSESGWVKVDRTFLDRSAFPNANAHSLYLWLKSKAPWSESTWGLGGRQILLPGGQMPVTLRNLAAQLRLSLQQIRTALSHLVRMGLVQRAVQSDLPRRLRYTLLTICDGLTGGGRVESTERSFNHNGNTKPNTQTNTLRTPPPEPLSTCNYSLFAEPEQPSENVTDGPTNTQTNTPLILDKKDKKDSSPTERDTPAAQPVPAKSPRALWIAAMKAKIGGANPGALIGRWFRDHGEGKVWEAHHDPLTAERADYRTWMCGRLRGGGKRWERPEHKSYLDYVQEAMEAANVDHHASRATAARDVTPMREAGSLAHA